MSETDPKTSPFWRFSLAFYRQTGVAPACLALQDEAGVDVNVMLFLLWQASQGRTFRVEDVRQVEAVVGPWRDTAVIPLRAVRRALKEPPPILPAGELEVFRNRVKAVELEAERLQQEALFRMAESAPRGSLGADRNAAASASLDAYQSLLKPFPSAAREAILAAFAKFDSPV